MTTKGSHTSLPRKLELFNICIFVRSLRKPFVEYVLYVLGRNFLYLIMILLCKPYINGCHEIFVSNSHGFKMCFFITRKFSQKLFFFASKILDGGGSTLLQYLRIMMLKWFQKSSKTSSFFTMGKEIKSVNYWMSWGSKGRLSSKTVFSLLIL